MEEEDITLHLVGLNYAELVEMKRDINALLVIYEKADEKNKKEFLDTLGPVEEWKEFLEVVSPIIMGKLLARKNRYFKQLKKFNNQ